METFTSKDALKMYVNTVDVYICECPCLNCYHIVVIIQNPAVARSLYELLPHSIIGL